MAQPLSFLFTFAFFYRYLHFLCVFVLDFHIGLIVTVFDAILMSRQTCEKLQCLYEYEL